MRRSNHENIDVLMLIGLVTEEEEEEGEGEEGKSHSKVGTRWVRQLVACDLILFSLKFGKTFLIYKTKLNFFRSIWTLEQSDNNKPPPKVITFPQKARKFSPKVTTDPP